MHSSCLLQHDSGRRLFRALPLRHWSGRVVTFLGSLDYFEGNASHAGEYFALLCFGAVGMTPMTCSVEPLMASLGSYSISTYILCGFRSMPPVPNPRSSTSCSAPSPLLSFFTASRSCFQRPWARPISTPSPMSRPLPPPRLALHRPRTDPHRPWLRVPPLFHVRTPDVYQVSVGLFHRAESRSVRRTASHYVHRLS